VPFITPAEEILCGLFSSSFIGLVVKTKKPALKGWQVEQQGQCLLLTSTELVLDSFSSVSLFYRRL